MKDDYTLSILPNSLIHFFFKGWENVLFELLGVKGLKHDQANPVLGQNFHAYACLFTCVSERISEAVFPLNSSSSARTSTSLKQVQH